MVRNPKPYIYLLGILPKKYTKLYKKSKGLFISDWNIISFVDLRIIYIINGLYTMFT